MQATGSNKSAAFAVGGMSCASCVAHVEKSAKSVDGVTQVDVNLARGRAVVQFDATKTHPDQIASAIQSAGYEAEPESESASGAATEQQRLQRQQSEANEWLRRAIIGIVLWFPVELAHFVMHVSAHHKDDRPALTWIDWTGLFTSSLAIALVGGGFYRSAWKALRQRTSNMDTLISMGATVAYGYSLVALLGHLLAGWTLADLYFVESTGLLALISLGHWLEARARASAGSSIHKLLELAPATALKLKSGPVARESGSGGNGLSIVSSETPATQTPEFEEVAVSSLHLGDHVLVRPGDRVPIDGVVVTGNASIDESMLTGESLPVTRKVGDAVIGGTISHDGAITVRVTRTGRDTALAQIVQLVETAQSSKPAVQKLADRISAVFVPAVLMIAVLTGVGWYVHGQINGLGSALMWGNIARAVCSVLIIACPCALGLAVPAAMMVGTGRGANRGILIRNIDALQNAERLDVIVLDKTGTVTSGKPAVESVTAVNGNRDDEVLRLAASAEQFSAHPLAAAIVAHARTKQVALATPSGFTTEPGSGVRATFDGTTILVGSPEMMRARGATITADANVIVARQDNGAVEPLGFIHLTDAIKSDSGPAIVALKRLGLRVVLLTGDSQRVAQDVASRVGIDDVRAQVKPDGKASAIRQLQSTDTTGAPRSRVAMVGDGVNDAPALAQADLGIAIGSGSDIAKETGDIVLVSGSLLGVASAIRLSRATMRTIRQNLFLAFVYNVVAIPLAAMGMLNPLIAAGAMALSDVSVIGNALLLKRARIDD